ncbi:LysR family transcriptional regulator [Leucothrix arctica]|uniref:LysR family transcriptional regulator n=1 Tax=Leucothrix arctica TaxID=1481894 RepID=A0A317CTT6_9GAMM|nr:LysR family transcriptional regulator [Leucothrix arctica]PWQ99722.1 LysR family transcriptional regulator [Leucothrix arctica]
MELRWLEDFIALAEAQHFSRAAEERHITQPTFSRRIKLLEEIMEVTLIDRQTLPLSLTPAGELFLQSAKDIVRIMQDTKSRCHDIRLEEAQRLRFATTQSLYISFYKTWLEPFALDKSIDIELNLQSTAWSGDDFVSALQQGKSDLMLCYWHPELEPLIALDREGFDYLKLNDEFLVPVSATDDNGEAYFCLPGNKQEPLSYIAYHKQSYFSPLINTVLPQLSDVHLLTMNENFHAVNVKAMIQEGFGLGWVPERLVQKDLANKRLKIAGDAHWHIPLEIRLYRNKQCQNPNLETFWQLLKQQTL